MSIVFNQNRRSCLLALGIMLSLASGCSLIKHEADATAEDRSRFRDLRYLVQAENSDSIVQDRGELGQHPDRTFRLDEVRQVKYSETRPAENTNDSTASDQSEIITLQAQSPDKAHVPPPHRLPQLLDPVSPPFRSIEQPLIAVPMESASPIPNANTWPSQTANEFEQPGDEFSSGEISQTSFLQPVELPETTAQESNSSETSSLQSTPPHAAHPPHESIPIVNETDPEDLESIVLQRAPHTDAKPLRNDVPASLDDTQDSESKESPVEPGELAEWETVVKDLKSTLESQVESPDFEDLPEPTQQRLEMNLALLRSLDSASTSGERFNNTAIAKLLPELIHPESDGRFADTLERLREVIDQANEQRRLKLLNAALCTRISGFGQIHRLSPESLKSNQRMLVYCEVENFVSRYRPEKSEYHTQLKGGFTIRDAARQVVQQVEFPEVVDVSHKRRRDFFIHLPVTLSDLQPGQYTLHVSLTDIGGEKTAQLDRPLVFQVR